jgi:Homeodomain-like domain
MLFALEGHDSKCVFSDATVEREELESRCRSRRLRAEDARRAGLVLMLARGESYAAVQAALGCDPSYVSRWKRRFEAEKLAGLYSKRVRCNEGLESVRGLGLPK